MTAPDTARQRRTIIEDYLRQPAELPPEVRRAAEAAMGGAPVQLFALADLDERLQLGRTWLLLGPAHLAVVPEGQAPRLIPRGDVLTVRESPGLSALVLTLGGAPGTPPLAVLRYTFRQRPAFAPILFLLEQARAGGAKTAAGLPADPAEVYQEALTEPIEKAQASVAQSRVAVFWRLMSYVGQHSAKAWLGFFMGLGLTLLSLIPPELGKRVVDDIVLAHAAGRLSLAEAYAAGWWTIGGILAVLIARDFMQWIRLRTMTMVGEYVARDLREAVYNHVHKLSVSYFSKEQTGSVISRVSSDTDRIWDFIAFGVTELTLSTLMLVGLSIVLVTQDAQLGLLMLVPVPFIGLGIYFLGRSLHRVFSRVWRKWSALTAVLSDTIPGIRVVKSFNQEDYERARFKKKNEAVMAEAVHGLKVWSTFWPMVFSLISMLTVVIYFVALPRMLGDGTPGSVTLTPGKFIAFLLYLGLFIGPLEAFGFFTRMINRALSSAHRVFEVLDTQPEIVDRPDPVRLTPVRGEVRYEDVVFGYDPVRSILKGVSFHVQPGEFIGLVGPSGAGKTTVINLLARFYDVTGGRILIDGTDLRELDSGHYRRQLGIVQQDPYLFFGTILDNIRYGASEATLDEVIAAAKAANAHDFILKLPYAYDTVVGERGHTLSGGERQRVSIARAILCNPRILILDEATSSVDTETERAIQEALDRLTAGRTVFAIAHRLSTLRKASRLLVLKDGQIAELGTHDELLAKEDGLYRKLYTLQRELHELYAV